MIRETSSGVVVPPDDPVAFAGALEHLADHRDSLAAMGRNARRLAQQQFDRRVLADRLVDVLESVARGDEFVRSATIGSADAGAQG